ncbi:hypothetical protein WAF17_11885 [Bernardetia sp. ABR2-2B]|uniref:hypothetical protein n=1 Tax=Bernardetia sp. ABR2-2B TaxID=3127472 RepID=UPI0030CB98DF
MISPYKKPLLRIDLVVQLLFLIILFGGYGMTFLSFHFPLEEFDFAFLFPILALAILGLINPIMNILHLVLGDYSDETHQLRKNYTFAILAYLGIGALGYLTALAFNAMWLLGIVGYFYIYGISHFFAIGYVYITILENKTQKIVERRLYY